MDLKIKIRRNTTLTATFTCDSPGNILEALGVPELTEEQKRKMEEADRNRAVFEKALWEHVMKEGWRDVDGDLIMESTHEICYRWNDDGTPAEIAIQPKRSIYDTTRG